jgi:hypothetical protein
MLLTEYQARGKTCPLIKPLGLCRASGCMAWRFGQQPRELLRNYHDAPAVEGHVAHGFPDGWQYQHTDVDRDGRRFDLLHRIAADDALRVGFCGVVGKVEG